MNELAFFITFLAVLWTLSLAIYWIFTPLLKKDLSALKEKHREYSTKNGLSNRLLRFVFVMMNAHALFPIRGLIIAISIVFLFIYIRKGI